jgi:hypothetical protein
MTIRYVLWRRFVWLVSVVALPVVAFLFFEPNIGAIAEPARVAAIVFIFGAGCTGAAVAILTRVGILQFRYSDADKRRWHYRMAEFVARMEHAQQRGFSSRYYESFGLTPPDQRDKQ